MEKRFAVWGEGNANSRLLREADMTDASVMEAVGHGYAIERSRWAVEVFTSEECIEASARLDDAVVGFARL